MSVEVKEFFIELRRSDMLIEEPPPSPYGKGILGPCIFGNKI